MKEKKRLIANLIAFIHFLGVILMLLNLPLVIFFPHYKYFALGSIFLTVVSWVIWLKCPFTIWESNFRSKSDKKKLLETDFITFYLEKLFKIKISTYSSQTIIYAYILSIILIACFKD